ncbi:MAG: OmpA family protein [Myxococcota bacterium]|nr:OmpA family protein [Myxococcota bacterium]
MNETLPSPHARSLRLTLGFLATLGLYSGLVSCAQTQAMDAFPPRLARPQPGDQVVAQDVIIVADASGSMDRNEVIPRQKAFLHSFVSGMPPGTYRVAFRVLGARESEQRPLKPMDRFDLIRRVSAFKWTGRETPLASILREYADHPPPEPKVTRFIIFSDGVPTRYGRYIGPDDTLAAARELVAATGPDLCLYTIELGDDPRGPDLLKSLAALTPCGSYHKLGELDDAEALYAFQQAIFNGPKPPPAPPKARRVIDLDEDGVDDRFDRCPKTPLGADVDPRGCWVIVDTVFETNRSRIRPNQKGSLDRAILILRANPALRIRLDGHTDDTGGAEYNLTLAQKRAESARDYIVSQGIAPSRLSVRSFGDSRPIASNDTEGGRSQNRRVELSILDD